MRCDESGIPGIKKGLSNAEVNLEKLDDAEQQYKTEFEKAYREYTRLQDSTTGIDPDALLAARKKLRHNFNSYATSTIQQVFGKDYDWLALHDSRQYVSNLLKENEPDPRSLRNRLCQAGKEREPQNQPRNQIKRQRLRKINGNDSSLLGT